MKSSLGLLSILGCIHAILAINAGAQNTITYLDRVDPTTTEVNIGAGTFRAETLSETAGTGNFKTFLKLNASPTEQGYNTSAKGVMDNMNGQGTPNLSAGDISVVQNLTERYLINVGIDLNKPSSGATRDQPLAAFQVYISPVGSQTTNNPTQLGTLLYNTDAVRENAFLLVVNRNSADGSGCSDLHIDPEPTLFTGDKRSDFSNFYVKIEGVGTGQAPQHPKLSFASDCGFDERRRDHRLKSMVSVPESSVAMVRAIPATGPLLRPVQR